MNSILSKIKIKRKLRKKGVTSSFLEMYPARNPMIVLERPATPNTPKENVSWRRPQTVPRQAPNISPLVMAK